MQEEETVFEKYLREKRQKKKQKKGKANAEDASAPFSDDDMDGHDLDDPFFRDAFRETTDKDTKKEGKKRKAKEAASTGDDVANEAELALLMMDDMEDGLNAGKHFDMDEIVKERGKKNKSKKNKKQKTNAIQEEDEFKVDLKDDRFSAVFNNPLYAVDPTSSKFKKTKAMGELLSERRRRCDTAEPSEQSSKKSELNLLVAKVRNA
jgi:hypothetical protein